MLPLISTTSAEYASGHKDTTALRKPYRLNVNQARKGTSAAYALGRESTSAAYALGNRSHSAEYALEVIVVRQNMHEGSQ